MILWIIGLVVLACVAIVGFYQGALRVAFSFLGLLLAALLASPVGSLLKPLIVILGLKNPVAVGFVAPFAAFVLVLVIFKCAALAVHKKVAAWYKYKSTDTQRMLWERMNARVGISLGLANGLIYFFAICTVLYALGYLTVQVSSGNDSWAVRLVNRLNDDLKTTGMDKAVAPFMPKSDLYYDASDVVADIFHTPLLQNRLANYPPLLLAGEKEEFKPLLDPGFQGQWLKSELSFGAFVNHEKVKPLVENREVVTNVLGMLGGDLKDLKTYLQTGKSPKFDDEKILGRWAFDFKASMAAARRKTPTMGSAEIRKLRAALGAFAKSTLIATVDQKAILKMPSVKGGKGTVQGRWKNTNGAYSINIGGGGGQQLDLEAQVDGRSIIFTREGTVLVFENTRV
jgi:hypothetical protein